MTTTAEPAAGRVAAPVAASDRTKGTEHGPDRPSEVEIPESIDAAFALLPPELRHIHARPFGRDEHGDPIADGRGRTVTGAVNYLRELAGDRVVENAPAGTEAADLNRMVETARAEAVDRLVDMLNIAVGDARYHVTADYLLNESNAYSYEFRLFVAAYGRVLSGDPDFYRNLGRRSIPGSIIRLARPMGVRGTYAFLPRFTAKYVQTDLRVIETNARSARLRWYGASQLERIDPAVRRHYIDFACQTYRATMGAIPTAGWGLDPSRVHQASCQLHGAEYCEWEFTWTQPERAGLGIVERLVGVSLSVGTFAYLVAQGPLWQYVAIVGATLLPAGLILYGGSARRRAREMREQQTLLLEQRDLADREYERGEEAKAQLQQSNFELQQRVAELTTLNELAVGLSSTLDLRELLASSLQTVVSYLRFDRALVLLADEEQGVLGSGHSVGGTPEMDALIAEIALPLDHPQSQLVSLYRADGPMLFRDVDQDDHEPNRLFAAALGVTAFLGTPLVTKGRTVGILAVDNRLSGRDVEPGDGPLLYTVGNIIAAAIENARLYTEIETQNRELEARVTQRTRALADSMEEAMAAREAAEAASATKSAFLSNVSHELRTPLTSVVGFTKLIRKRLDDVIFPAITGGAGAAGGGGTTGGGGATGTGATGTGATGAAATGTGAPGTAVATGDPKLDRAVRQVGENLEIIIAEGDRLTALINDVLDLAKIEAGRFEFKREPLEVDELIARGSAATDSLFTATGLELGHEIAADLPTIVGDRDRLIQVVINLLSNAVKFTPAGSVTVRARRIGDDVEVAVADTGIGIAAGDQDKVWEQFGQGGDTLTDKPRGTGLGLPICREIVEHHGGRIWLESTLGEGSTFLFTLPIADADAEGGRAAEAASASEPSA